MRGWCPKAIFLCLLALLSTAHLTAQSCQVCMRALDPTASQSFLAGNGASSTLSNCGLAVNSSSSTALTVTGGAHVTASSIQVVGGYSINNGGSTTPTPTTGAPSITDPFAGVPSPSIGTCVNHPNYSQYGNYQIYPGTYCGGLDISNGSTANFNPGVYVIDGGGVQFQSATITGTGVTFYITGSSFTNNQLAAIANGTSVNLSAPTSGTYQGLLFFQDRTISNSALSSSFAGGASMALTGAMDFPTTALQFNNGSSSTANVAIIGRTINLEGGVGVKLNSSSPVLPPVAVSVAPTAATLYGNQTQQFSASVANGCSGSVTWSISPSSGAGSIGSNGLYSAPATITSQQTVTVTATSVSDTTKTATATVVLEPPISVSVAPATATLYGGQTQQFTATVTNATNTAVNWSVSPASGAGSVSSSGLYTAPASIGAPQTVTVTATSAVNTTKTATATITLEPAISVALLPTTATLYASQTQQFSATVSNTNNSAVTWSISPSSGAGTINASGLYTAPASIASQTTVTVTATSQANSAATASATVTLTPAISVSITPTTATLYASQTQQFSATVTNTSNTAVTWSISPSSGAGSINASGLYTAPASIASQTTVTVTATSQANSAATATATVTLTPAITVSVSPTTATLYASQTQQFSATVTNTSNTAVTWSISPSSGAGTINASGLYTAPASIASQTNVTVTATSQANSAAAAAATITLQPPIAVLVGPATVTLYANQTQQFSATVSNTSNTAVTWSISPSSGAGSINPAGLYTAPASIASPQTVTVTATSQASGAIASTGTVTLSPPVSVSVNPTTATLNATQTQQFAATVTNTSNTGVTWSISPTGTGSISASGLYTAPASIASQTTVSVTATSQADPTQSAIAAITLQPTNSVAVTPSTVNLFAGQSQQFTASLTNSPNASFTWTISPAGLGSISSTGLYTAPMEANVQAVTVTATDAADSTQSGTAVVNLLFTPIRVNSGGPAYTDAQGLLWAADTNYTTGCGGNGQTFGFTDPAGESAIYADGRSCPNGISNSPYSMLYQFTVPNMDYLVTLYFADPTYGSPNQRLFQVQLNGASNSVLSSVDVAANSGGQYLPWSTTVPVTVTNGQIAIGFTPIRDWPIINAIQIVPAGSIDVEPSTATLSERQTVQFSAYVPGTSNSPVTWSIAPANAGSISSIGLYAAPDTIAAATTVTVTATSASTGLAGTALVSLQPTDPDSFSPIRVNAGGPSYTDAQGLFWAADTNYTTGCGGNGQTFGFADPAGESAIYADGRSCPNTMGGTPYSMLYQFSVPNMDYLVTLYFADPTYGSPNQRLFQVQVNGATNSSLYSVDVAANAGAQFVPWTTTLPVTVTNGQINIGFVPIRDWPIINAIQIVPANNLDVEPPATTLSERQTVQFAALAGGAPDATVSWSIAPANAGSISAAGLYTAPSSIASATSVTVTATDGNNPNLFGTAVVNLQPTDPDSFSPIRVNAGGPSYTDPQGLVWVADTNYTTGCGGNGQTFGFADPTGLSAIYADGRNCPNTMSNSSYSMLYQFNVPNMDYLVTLYFADPTYSSPNQRLFQVEVNGATNSSLYSVDVAANAKGQYLPWTTTVPVTVTNGQINIGFTPIRDWPIINAIQIVPANNLDVEPGATTLSERQTVQLSALSAGAVDSTVTWSISPASAGAISATGLYTSPSSIAAAMTVIITATDATNTNLFGTAMVYLQPTDPDSFSPIRVNAGGPAYTDAQGLVWAADTNYTTGCGGNGQTFGFADPAGESAIYADGRECPNTMGNTPYSMLYQFNVPNMDYLVTLYFADPNYGSPQQRLFQVQVNGVTNTTLETLDVAANSGGQYFPWSTTVPVTVTNGQIAIGFTPIRDWPIINAIQIVPANNLDVEPGVTSLSERQSLQFTALSAGTADSTVSWTINPAGTGTISTTGLYTAPSTISAPTTVTITATDMSNSNLFGTAVVNLQPTDPNSFSPIRINSGGPAYTDPQGLLWSADNSYITGCGGNGQTFGFTDPAGLSSIYADGRECPNLMNGSSYSMLYQFTVPNMDYLVTLYFADPNYGSPGQRQFQVEVNGATNSSLYNLDVAANSGGQYMPWSTTVPVSVTNGQIAIGFTPIRDWPIINAIQIVTANSVEVEPSATTLSERQMLQFSALSAGTSTSAVTWTISPASAGSISATGLYIAPSSITSASTVTVIATSTTNPNLFGTALVNLAPADPDAFTPIRINSGGPAYTDAQDLLWSADSNYTTGCGGNGQTFGFTDPAGLSAIYADGRECPNLMSGSAYSMLYQFSVPNMDYLVTLYFADPNYGSPNQRQFQVQVNGATNSTLKSVDVAANAGGQYLPWSTTIPVTVTNGQINIGFTPIRDWPIINAIQIVAMNAIEVVPNAPALAERQTVQFSAFAAGNAAAVTWSISPANLGSISSTGVYTAPASIAAATTVTVTATSAANPNLFGTAVVSLSPSDPNSVAPLLINAGGPALTDPQGLVWAADTGYTTGCGGNGQSFSFTPPAGLNPVYADGRECANSISNSPFSMLYQFTVPNMAYVVTLKFADPNYGQAGQREFQVSINGATNPALNLVDVAGSAGAQYTPYDIAIPVNVTANQISIGFTPIRDWPIVNAIEIVPLGAVQVEPPTATLFAPQVQQFTAIVADPANAGVVWSLTPAGLGTISSAGLYAAPASVTSPQTVTVTATDAANAAWYSSASVTLVPPSAVVLTPTSVNLTSGQSQQFTVETNGGVVTAVWSISPVGMGTISSTGLYTAPAGVFTAITVTLTASVLGAPATATINLVPAVNVTVSPSAITMGPAQAQQFAANVTGTWNTGVIWTVQGSGTITSNGVYTAPAAITGQSTATITATSAAVPGVAGLATVTLAPAVSSVSVSVTPSIASLAATEAQQFTATVSGTANTAVTWTITPAIGSISAAGLYTAPSNINAAQTVTVQAASVADPTNSATATISLLPGSNGYSYRRPIVINHTYVPNTDQTNLPILISGTYSYLANVSNGGDVQNANGFDIIFSSDCAGMQKLNHEIESYNPTTGAINMWVQIPTVSHTTDTVFYVSYGNSSITTSQENKPGVWDTNYQMVLHLAETAAPYLDSSGNQHSSTGGVYPTAAAGKIGGAQAFDGLSQYIAYSQAQSPKPNGAISMEAWVKTTGTMPGGLFGKWESDGTNPTDESYEVFYRAGGQPSGLLNSTGNSPIEVDAGAAINDGNWHHVAVTAPPTGTASIYVDGVLSGSLTNTSSLLATTTDRLLIGATSLATGGSFTHGSIDEVRISNSVRSADWIAAEYASQNSPSTFYTIYPANTNSIDPPSASLGASQTQQFTSMFTVSASATSSNPLVLLGAVQTPSSAESVAISGNIAYVCDANEVSIINISNLSSPTFLGAALASSLQNDGINDCSIQNNSLVTFIDTQNSTLGDNPSFVAFGLANPMQPQLIASTEINKRFFNPPVFQGNIAFVPIFAYDFFFGFWDGQNGDVVAVDISNLASPQVLGTLETQTSSVNGGNYPIFGVTLVNNQTLYAGSTTAAQGTNNGVGQLTVVNISNPAAMSVVTQVQVPGTIDVYAPMIQGNLAIAGGDNGGYCGCFVPSNGIAFVGNFVINTFDITNPTSPVLLATVPTAYQGSAGSAAIGTNLFLFSVFDSNLNPVLLLVDTSNPANPVITATYNTPQRVNQMVVAGNLLHAADGTGGYAIYQIPGTTPQQYNLTASCAGPANWVLNPPGVGTISSTGMYTAPATLTGAQAVTVTATSQTDPTETASATVSLSQVLTTTLNTVTPGPYLAGTPASFQANVTSQGENPVSGITVNLTVTGANGGSYSAVTDSNGNASFSYTGIARGADTLVATPAGNAGPSSSPLLVLWISPANAISTTAVTGEFFASCPSGCQTFATPSTQTPAFLQNFPNVMFDPPSGMLANNTTGVTSSTLPFTDVVVNGSGAITGTIIVQGNGVQAGIGTLAGFSAVFRGSLVVVQAGSFTFNVASEDGFIFGVGNGAVRVSGINVNPPASGVTVFSQYPVMGANNGPPASGPTPIVISFPATGSYPYEIDYQSGVGSDPSLAIAVTQGFSTQALPPLDTLTLTETSNSTLLQGQQAMFTIQALDETGAARAQLPMLVSVTGANPQTVQATTNANGMATVSYSGTTAGADLIQASATTGGQSLYSNQAAETWSNSTSQPPSITVVGDSTLTLPNPGVYQATVADPDAPNGGAISVAWSEVSGPGTATFSAPTALATGATFSAPGGYVLQVTATDLLGSQSLQLNITVNPAPAIVQGWLATPVDGSTVTGVVPITLASGITLTSGTLTYWPVSNPNAVVVLNSSTVGSGTIGSLDTTLLANGGYIVELSASTGGSPQNFEATVTVVGNYKPGRLTATVTDLTVPAPGLPIQIQRTYDSLTRAESLDFGNGWSLGVDVQLEVSPQSNVTLTLNQQRKTFYFTPVPIFGGPFGGIGLYKSAFTAEPGFYGTLTASLDGCIVIDILVPIGNRWMCASETPYQPQTYTYTDPYGRVYTIAANGGLKSIQDLGGNTITVTPTGISSSNGLSVPFVRDGLGRVTQITDTLGNNYLYGYDGNGNLASVTYPGLSTPAHYTYDSTNLYTGGTDSRGTPLPVTTYDANGRLQMVTDALGETTTYTYNVPAQSTTVTYPPDANGNVGTATMVYDSYGDLLSSTDPLGLITTNTYDANHDLLSVTDPLGHTTSYTYDSNGNQISMSYPKTPTSDNTTSYTVYNAYSEPAQTTDQLGNVTNFSYDSNFWPQLASDPIGPVASFTFNTNGTMAALDVGYDLTVTSGTATTYAYDQYGNLISKTDALDRQTQYTYDTLGRQITMTPPLPSGATVATDSTTNTYDPLGNVINVTAPQGRTTSNQYDANNNKLATTDSNGHTTSYQYDALNRVSQVTYPTSPATTMTYTYDFRNNVIGTTDQAGHVTYNLYDLDGRLTSTTLSYGTPQAATTSYTYYNDGRKATQTDPLGHTTTYNYDAAGRTIGTIDAQGNATQYAYDDANNQIQAIDPNGHKTQSQYDARHRPTQVTYDDGTTTLYAYDGPANLLSATDQAGNTVRYTYDYANQLQSVIQSASPNPQNTTSYAYDVDGNLTTLTDANGHTTHNNFDLLNELNAETLPSGSPTQTRTYDPNGNLVSLTDYNGRTTTYAYDQLNRLLSRTPDPSLTDTPETFTYTRTGKRATMTDASGTTTYTYDSMDRLASKATPQGTLSYTYDAASNVASVTSSNANGMSVQYTYDTLNRLSTVVDNRLLAGANTTSYTYDSASNLATVRYPTGLQSTFDYDDLNRLRTLNGSAASYNYTLGPTGNRLSGVESSGRTVNWSYDGIYRLANEVITLDPHSNNGTVSYGLDPVGNRLSQTSSLSGISSGTFTYNVDDRLSTETYDNNGNTLGTGGGTLVYDFENRLKSMNNGAVTVLYDGDGNRAAKTVNGATTRYLVDDLNPTGYAQVIDEITNGVVTRTYTYGLQRVDENQLISGVWAPSFYVYDGLGTVRQLTDAAGTVTDTYGYDGWGNLVDTSGGTSNLYLYRGEQYDPDLKLYYLRARYFNQATGRFMTRDTYAGDTSHPQTLQRYIYAIGNPVNWLDRTGHNAAVDYTLLLSALVLTAGTQVAMAQSAGSIRCIWCEAASQLAAALFVDLVQPGVKVLGEVAGRTICTVAVLTAAFSPPKPLPAPPPVQAPTSTPGDPCKDLQQLIYQAMNQVADRVGDLLDDNLDLYGTARSAPNPSLPPGSGSWVGHLNQVEGWQNRLGNLISQAGKLGCPVPPGAWGLATRGLPSQPRGN